MIKKLLIIKILLLPLLFLGCSTITIAPSSIAPVSGTVALLPIQTTSDIQREKLLSLHQRITDELRSSGYSVLSSDEIFNLCKEGLSCLKELAKYYSVKNVLSVKINSEHSVGFLGTYYDSLSGDISLDDMNGKTLYSYSVSESEKSGILFNTGQVLEALKFSGSNTNETFAQLSDKFTTSLVTSLPKASAIPQQQIRQSIQILNTKVDLIKDSLYKVCAQGSEHAIAKLVISSNQFPLREGHLGMYCSIIPSIALQLSPNANTKDQFISGGGEAKIVLTSAYGDSTQRFFEFGDFAICEPTSLLIKKTSSLGAQVSLACNENQLNVNSICHQQSLQCEKTSFVVFDAASVAEPYEKIGVLNIRNRRLNSRKSTIVAFSVSPDGSTSIPMEIK